MLNLIIKDYRAFGHYIIFQFFFVIGLMSFGMFLDKSGNMTFVALMFYPLIIPCLILLSDKQYEGMINALPCSRLSFVLGKYIGGLFASILIMSIGLLYGYLVNTYIVTNGVRFNEIFSLRGLSLLLIPLVVFNSLIFPVFFRFSKQKGSKVMIVILTVILFAVLIGIIYAEKNLPADIMRTDMDIMPVLSHYIIEKINSIGPDRFVVILLGGSGGLLLISFVLSLFGFSAKDIGGE